jgi:hypothetical protein
MQKLQTETEDARNHLAIYKGVYETKFLSGISASTEPTYE